MQEKKVKTALCQFLFPFSIKAGRHKEMAVMLEGEGFERFSLDNSGQETAFYGEDYRVDHRSLELFFLPNIELYFYPKKYEKSALNRYSKKIDLQCVLDTHCTRHSFAIHSMDVIICPFDLCLLTIRTELADKNAVYSEVLNYINHFRIMQTISDEFEDTKIQAGEKSFDNMIDFVFQALCPNLVPFINKEDAEQSYFESLPFFIDERMLVVSFLKFEEGTEFDHTDFIRAGQIFGFDRDRKPVAGATSKQYMDEYFKKHVYYRWAPNTYYVASDHNFCCLTTEKGSLATQLANQMYGQYYYGFLLYFFYKIVLLKLSYDYSKLSLSKDHEKVEKLIKSITIFSSRYFFTEVISHTQGSELFRRVFAVLNIQPLYLDAKETLSNLYQTQEKMADKRTGNVLLILTIYTVITGIYGMNLVIEDWKGSWSFKKAFHYTLFENIALFMALSGIVIGIALGLRSIRDWLKEKFKRNEF